MLDHGEERLRAHASYLWERLQDGWDWLRKDPGIDSQNFLMGSSDLIRPLFLLGALLIVGMSLLSHRFLYADGSFFLINMLQNGGFWVFDAPRAFAQYTTQLPLALALWADLRDIEWQRLLFGLGLYLPFILSLALCLFLIRDRWRLALVLSGICIGFGPGFTFIVSEAHVHAAVFWMSIACLEGAHRRLRYAGLLMFFSFWSLRLYESQMFLAWVLIGLMSISLYKSQDKLIRLTLGGAIFLQTLGVALAFYSYLHPRDPANANGFKFTLLRVLESNLHLPIFAGLLLACAVVSLAPRSKRVLSFIIFGLFSAILPAAFYWMWPQMLQVESSLDGRVFQLFAPFFCGGLLIITTWLPRLRFRVVIPFALSMGLFQLAYQSNVIMQWHGFYKFFKGELQSVEAGEPKDYRTTSLALPLLGRQILSPFIMPWSLPALSLAIENGRYSFRIIYDPSQGFQPIDPSGAIPQISLGEVVLSGSDRLAFGDGWSKPEGKDRWLNGPEGKLYFKLPSNTLPSRLHMAVGGEPGQVLQIQVNEYEAETRTIGEKFEVSIDLGDQFRAGDGLYHVSIASPGMPTSLGPESSRRTSLSIRSIKVE